MKLEGSNFITPKCLDCDRPATWMRHTQFAGKHPFCLEHAEGEKDFLEDGASSFFWRKIQTMKKIVLTGAPHSGKSTLVEALLEEGHLTIPETAITVIESLNDLLGLNGALKWRRNHFDAFQELISERQFYMEAAFDLTSDAPAIFMDRGAFDGIAFARHFHKKFPEKASQYIEDARYDQVFLLDLVVPFDHRNDTGRVETVEDCQALQQHLQDVYTEIGLEPIVVPLMPVEDRLQFILENIDD